MIRRFAATLCLAALPALAQAQTASLVADRLEIAADDRLIAEGEVEVLYGTTRLTATRVIFDRSEDRLSIEGPITLTEGEDVIVLADAAALDPELRNGILTSARLVLDRQLQLAANRIARVDGRYTELSKSVASACQVCPDNPVPTWEIRARRIVHDELERQLYFENATFRLLGVPIFYIPRLRLPDPTLERATGFLLPSVRTTSRLGSGLKLPYFIRMGDHADLTLAPYISPRTDTLQFRYRQAVAPGALEFEGAITSDELEPGKTRGFLFGEGSFALPRDYRLSFDLELVSDSAYLLDYGGSEQDRLESEVALERMRRDKFFRASVTNFRTLRPSELSIENELPEVYGTVKWERRYDALGGDLTLGFDTYTLYRESSDSPEGRDVQRLAVDVGWRDDTTLANGMVAEARLGAAAAGYAVTQDDSFDEAPGRVAPRAAVALRWPLGRTNASGAHHLLEPVVQLAWAHSTGDAIPNEDSRLIEFDEGNLFGFGRYPGDDAVEDGARADLGLRWTRYDPAGWSLGLAGGRVLRLEDSGFAEGTGLSGDSSDWLVSGQLAMDDLTLTGRALFGSDFSFTRNEMRLAYDGGRAAVSATYLWLEAEPGQNLLETRELDLDAAWRITPGWTGRLDGRFDLDAEETSRAGLGLVYQSECLTVDLSLSRRFTSSTSVSPTTDFGLQVSLAGFGSGAGDAVPARRCRG